MPPAPTQTRSHPESAIPARATDRWRWAYYALTFVNIATIGGAFLFGRALHSQYEQVIEIDNFWSTAVNQIGVISSTITAANMPGNNVFDTHDPVLERHLKSKADKQFEQLLPALEQHLKDAPNHTDQAAALSARLSEIKDLYRVLDARAEAIFDAVSAGQLKVAGSVMASMDRTASESTRLLSELTQGINQLQKQDFKAAQRKTELQSRLELLLLASLGLVVLVALAFGRKMFAFLNAQAAEAEASRLRAEAAGHELACQSFALDQHSIVAVTDTAGRIRYANDKFCEISGYSRQELIGQNHKIINSGHHPKGFFKAMYQSVASGEVWHAEIKNTAKDGSHYWVDTTIAPYRNEAGTIESFVAIRNDITDRKNAEERLSKALEIARKATEDADAANSAKGDFLATMSHEIRTPMNSVIGFSNLLLDSNLSGEAQNYAESILSSGQSLLGIINDILDFSKIEAGKLDVETMPFDLGQTAEEVLGLLANAASKKNLEFLLRYDPALPKGFVADPGRIRQIIVNLAGNALKFTESGHVYIEIAPDPAAPNDFARISISDTGIGIPAEVQKTLFSKFTQADSSTSRKFGGTGLGLAISKLLAELMGGEIGLSSEPGEGSTFWFTLPIPPTPVQLPEEEGQPDVSGKKILIVDDYPLNRTLLQEQCAQWGLLCETAKNGEEALQALQAANDQGDPYHAALIDYCMPGMDGLQLGQRILADSELNSTKLLMLTSGSSLADRPRFLEMGFDAFFLKPIVKPAQLRIALAKAFGIACLSASSPDRGSQYAEARAPAGAFRILVVDDTTLNQTLLQSILGQKFGYRVDTAANGQEAVHQFTAFKYDAIFMDCMMPIMDGFEASREIRAIEAESQRPKTPIVALTANALLGDDQKCYEAGMDDYLKKPIEQDALIAVLQRWLGSDQTAEVPSAAPKPAQSSRPETEAEAADDPNRYLDLERLQTVFAGQPEIVSEVLDVFSQTLAEFLDKTRGYETLEELAHIAHTVKGTSAECGAEVLSALADQVEQGSKEGESDDLLRLVGEMVIAMERTQTCVDATRESAG